MEIIRLDDTNVEAAAARAAAVLRAGGIVLYPTDTLYGLGVDAVNRPALERLRALKGREKKKPISVIVAAPEKMDEHVHAHAEARALAEKHFPGALTLVLAAKDTIPTEIQLNGAVGIRIPNDPFALALARAFGKPFTATSANKAGQQTPAAVLDILAQLAPLGHHVDLVIDAGERAGGRPSTVVLYTGDTPYVLREGAISREELGL